MDPHALGERAGFRRFWSAFRPARVLYWSPVVFVLAILYACRPFWLGFYHDDWCNFVHPVVRFGRFSPGMLRHFWINHAGQSRHLYAILSWLLASLLGTSPWLWQTGLAVGCVVMAGLMARLASSLNALGEGRFHISPLAVLLTFLVVPWTYGFTAWPTELPVHAALSFFLASAVLTVRALARQAVSYAALPCFLLSCLTYEACYLQFVPVLGLCWVLSPHRVRKSYLLKLGLMLAGFCLTQVAAVGIRVVSGPLTGTKSFNPQWFFLAKVVTSYLDYNLFLPSLSGYKTLPRYSAYYLALLFLLSFVSLRVRRHGLEGLRLVTQLSTRNLGSAVLAAGCIAVLLGGALLSVVLHAMAHYGINGVGLMSKTSMVLTVWLCLLVGVLGGRFAAKDAAHRRLFRAALVGLLVFGLGVASFKRLGDWAGAWGLEKAVLQAVPAEQLARLPRDTLIVALVPNEYHWVTVFAAPWDLGHAVSATYPAAARSQGGEGFRFYPHPPTWRTSWDGKTLQQGLKGSAPCWSFPAREVWVWDYFTRQLYQAPKNLLFE
jgi:hypothetical protein